MVTNFCNDELNEEYKNLAVALVKKMGGQHDVPFNRGILEVWASAVIYVLGQINFLFDDDCEPYKTPDDICNYFNTQKSIVSQKAKSISDLLKIKYFDNEFSTELIKESEIQVGNDSNRTEASKSLGGYLKSGLSKILSNFSHDSTNDDEYEEDFDDFDIFELVDNDGLMSYFDYSSDCTTLDEYELAIENFKEEKGKEYFEENKGYFWGLVETRPFMQNLFEYSELLWISGLKEKSIEICEYMLELNPNDNQEIRDSLVNYYIDLGRLKSAENLLDRYSRDIGANASYSRLLIAIKNKEDKKIIKKLYDKAFEDNPYIIDYIFNKKQFDDILPFYGVGDENEARYYKLLCLNNWDKKSLKTLRKIMK